MKAILYSKAGQKKDEVVLNPQVFAARVNQRLLDLVQNAYSANLRRGTHDTKTRKEVSGGGKKPWKQKGTGRARHSSIRSPIWRGGGTVFGPHPRSYFVNLSKTMRQKALISALSLRGEQKGLFLVEDLKLGSPKTREWIQIFKSLPLDGKRALCVVHKLDENIRRASQNYSSVIDVREASNLNAYHVMQRTKIVIEHEAIPTIESRVLDGQLSSVGAAEGGDVEIVVKKVRKKKVAAAEGRADKKITAKKPKKS
ncbi:MAG: 50S ribosomal protein L4 [Candidatus Omnitrophica bacterium]|nr:50S ribosomal protein L4 [Candidatus Omnitrophota bacterium]